MRKVVYAMSVSLDGYIEARGGDLSWSYPDEELHRHFNVRESNIDEYQLYIHPVILGAGKAMFQQIENKINLQLQETHVFRSGVLLLVYKKVEQ